MKMSKKIICLFVAAVLIVGGSFTPYRAFAAFDENGLSLKIDTSNVILPDTWQQIKNAAIIHLIIFNLKKCVNLGDVLDGAVRPRNTETSILGLIDLLDGVWDKGAVFNADVTGGINVDINVGPWLSSFFGTESGKIECNDWTSNGNGNLFNMFVYILKNYKSGVDLNIGNTSSVGVDDRLRVVCNGIKRGLLAPSDSLAILNDKACNSSDVSWYTGGGKEDQLAYLRQVFEEFRLNSGNDFIIPFDGKDGHPLSYFDTIDGYYLYSRDFETQCKDLDQNFSESPIDGSTMRFYVDNNSGKVTKRFYIIDSKNNNASASFVGGTEEEYTKTCTDLIMRMNEIIGPYLQFINSKIGKVCAAGVDEAIEEKRKEINEKYLQNTSASETEKTDSQLVLDEYDRIQREGEYVARRMSEEGEDEVLERIYATSIDVGPVPMVEPTEYIWTCRSHLPYINVEIAEEGDLADALKNEFYDACYDTMDLAWVVCPVINWVSGTADALSELIDGFF